jgi:AcrR family transcriptional regulator
MPAPGNHDARREDVSEAVWRVLSRCGVGGLTIRAVAAEMGATTGLVSHYFPTKGELIAHARSVAELRTFIMDRRVVSSEGYESLRATILDVLPLTPEKVDLNRAWVSFWDAAIGDPELHRLETLRYQNWRAKLRSHIEMAQTKNELTNTISSEELSEMVASFAHGLVVQALFDAHLFTAEHQTDLVDSFLKTLAPIRTKNRS